MHELPVAKPHRDAIYTTSHGGTLKVSEDGRSYTYAYGPPGLTGLLHNSFALRAAIFASLGGLLFGYDQGVVANILVMKGFVERFPVGPWEKGLMSMSRLLGSSYLIQLSFSALHVASMLELGSLVGAISSGLFADHFSRRQAIIAACGPLA